MILGAYKPSLKLLIPGTCEFHQKSAIQSGNYSHIIVSILLITCLAKLVYSGINKS